MSTSKNLPLYEHVEIIDIATEGRSIGKVDDLVIFIEKVVPGDVVDIQLTKKKKSFAEARPVHFHQYSSLRKDPFCSHFGTCGGCKWQHLDYQAQLGFKQKQVEDALTHLAKIKIPEIARIIPSEKTTYYRNKLEFTFAHTQWISDHSLVKENRDIPNPGLGFHIPKRFDKILDVTHCYLQADPSNAIRLFIRKYALDNDLSFFDLRRQEGFLRNLIIRTTTEGELMVVMVFAQDLAEDIQQMMEAIKKEFPQITSLQYIINQKRNDTIYDQEVICYHGTDYITEKMDDLSFRVGLKSFYQTNSTQAKKLYEIAAAFAEFQGNELVYDLYTGTGTIANFIARKVKKVIGIEYVPSAIEDAKINAGINHINNAIFFAGDIKNVMNNDFIHEHGRPDVVITDPPRAGMHTDVVNKLLEIAPLKIVYVSCNPATQARDLAILDEKYELMKVQPVDMFPHTEHVENVVLLKLKN